MVTFDNDFLAEAYVRSTKLPWPLLIDKSRELYRAYGLEQLGWWGHFNPLSIGKYLLLTLRGFWPGTPGADWQQLGGDVLVNPQGLIALIHRSRNSHDRPAVSKILSLIQSGNRSSSKENEHVL